MKKSMTKMIQTLQTSLREPGAEKKRAEGPLKLGRIRVLVLLGILLPFLSQAESFSGFSKPFRSLPKSFQLPGQLRQQLQSQGFQFLASKLETAHGVTTRKFQITQDGIEVLGAVAMTHTGPLSLAPSALAASAEEADSSLIPSFDISTKPLLGAHEASQIALGMVGNRDLEVLPELKILPSEKEDGSATLIYWVTVATSENEAGRDLLIDANRGTLIADISHHLEIAPHLILFADDTCQVLDESSGYPLSINLPNCPVAVRNGIARPIADETALRANKNSEDVLNYYWIHHSRDSFDDQGSLLTSVVHVGKAFANAFWSSDRNFMAYGDGDGVVMTDLTRSLDVAGHEMTHGVTSHTSQLIYQSESGALNEAFSDFFGIAVAARSRNTEPDWAIGKEIFLNERKNIGLRNLKDPGSITTRYRDDQGQVVKKPYPAHVKDQFTTKNPCSSQNDRCFVHVNSMIPGHAMYLMAEAIGLERTEALMYVTLTQYLTKTSTFTVFKTQTMKACRQLYSPAECSQVRAAFQSVGL